MAIERNITTADKWFTGTDKRFSTPVLGDPETVAEDASAWTMSWMLKRRPRDPDADALIHKQTSNGSITISGVFDAVAANNLQRVRWSVSDEDLAAAEIRAGKTYYHELKRFGDGTEEILVYGTVVLLQAVHVD